MAAGLSYSQVCFCAPNSQPTQRVGISHKCHGPFKQR
jgi:hypothetical protein